MSCDDDHVDAALHISLIAACVYEERKKFGKYYVAAERDLSDLFSFLPHFTRLCVASCVESAIHAHILTHCYDISLRKRVLFSYLSLIEDYELSFSLRRKPLLYI